MTRLKILAAAILASALASPAMAQQAVDQAGAKTGQKTGQETAQKTGQKAAQKTSQNQRQDVRQGQRKVAARHDRKWQSSYNRRDVDRQANRDNTFGPGNVAAGVVGGAIGTAGAIATAPFRAGDAYAYDNGYNNYYGQGYGGRDWKTYAAHNALACTPGTWIKGEDGRRYPCQ
jgi:hypothetical protein